MEFARGGEPGLEALSEREFDVLVTDMRMPGVDGAELLRFAQREQPQMLRIVLSGHVELATTLEVVNTAHQFLTKPTEGEQLREAIQRAAQLHELVRDERVRALVGGVDVLPTPPQVYMDLTRALANPDTGIRDLTPIVERDASLSAKTMQLVSSPFFGIGRRITSLEQAISYLGVETLKGMALAVGAVRCLTPREQVVGLDPAADQEVALCAMRIVRELLPAGPDADMAAFAALLHNLGKMVLACRAPEAFASVLQEAADSERPLWEVEREQLGYTHAEVGAYLLALWGLPYPIVEAVARHLDPAQSGARQFDALAATHAAVCLARQSLQSEDAPHWDQAFLTDVGVGERLSEWARVANTVREAS